MKWKPETRGYGYFFLKTQTVFERFPGEFLLCQEWTVRENKERYQLAEKGLRRAFFKDIEEVTVIFQA